jgi:hypothetical protein
MLCAKTRSADVGNVVGDQVERLAPSHKGGACCVETTVHAKEQSTGTAIEERVRLAVSD